MVSAPAPVYSSPNIKPDSFSSLSLLWKVATSAVRVSHTKHLQFLPTQNEDSPPIELSTGETNTDKPFALSGLPFANHVR